MGKVNAFTDLYVWQKSKNLFLEVYGQWHLAKSDHWFKSQLLSAALSISNNIAEGFERRSRKEFLQFLAIAKGSCGEVRSMLILAVESQMRSQEALQKTIDLSYEVSQLLYLLMNSLNEPQFKTTASEPHVLYGIGNDLSNDIILISSRLNAE